MKVKHEGKSVEVLDKKCLSRKCFWLGQDKGSYVAGRGYTSYHKTPQWCCMRRHLHGCPTAGTCSGCKMSFVEGEKVCRSCGGEL